MIMTIVAFVSILLIGVFGTILLLDRRNLRAADVIILGAGLGISILPIMGYLAVLLGRFSAVTLASAFSLFLIIAGIVFFDRLEVSAFSQLKKRITQARIRRVEMKSIVTSGVIATFGLLLRLRSVFYVDVISAIDPWLWMYHTRFILDSGTIDFSQAGAYPLGFVMLTATLLFGNQGYTDVYFLFQFIGSAISFLTILIVYRVIDYHFRYRTGPAIIGSMAFATGNLAQFRGRIATPETIAITLLIIFVSYLYIYRGNSKTVGVVLLVGLVLYHPTTAIIGLGVWFLTELRELKRESILGGIASLLKYGLVLLLLLLPLLITLFINSDPIARYVFYIGETPPSDSGIPLYRIVWNSLNSYAGYSAGILLFGVSLIAIIRSFLNGQIENRFAISLWFVCTIWALLTFVPIIIFQYGGPRMATFVVFALGILIASEYVHLIDGGVRPLDGNGLRKSKALAVLCVFVSLQLLYGISYTHINERLVSENQLDALEWVATNQQDVDGVYVYDSWKNRVALAVLYPLRPFSNDSIRSGNTTVINAYLRNQGRILSVVIMEGEALKIHADILGWIRLVNFSDACIYRVTFP